MRRRVHTIITPVRLGHGRWAELGPQLATAVARLARARRGSINGVEDQFALQAVSPINFLHLYALKQPSWRPPRVAQGSPHPGRCMGLSLSP